MLTCYRANEIETSSLLHLLVFLGVVDSRENWKLFNVNNLNSKVDSRENKISHKKVCMECLSQSSSYVLVLIS